MFVALLFVGASVTSADSILNQYIPLAVLALLFVVIVVAVVGSVMELRELR
jgi:hypothetical protein